MNKGKFIVFEALDGAGKDTQIKKAIKYLKHNNIEAIYECEPTTSNPIGRLIKFLLAKKEINGRPLDSSTMINLYQADRNEHIKDIQKALDEGKWVVCSRYWYSTFAYQTVGSSKLRTEVIDHSCDLLKPDLVIYLDTDVDRCLNRIVKRGENLEAFETKEYLTKVYDNYKFLWFAYSKQLLNINLAIVNGNNTKNKVFCDIKSCLQSLMKCDNIASIGDIL